MTCTFAPGENEAAAAARRIGFPAAVKISAEGIAHKTDTGGVILNLMSESEVREAFRTIRDRCAQRAPMALFKGVFVQKMAHSERLREVCIRAATDPVLGAAVSFRPAAAPEKFSQSAQWKSCRSRSLWRAA